MADFEFTKVRKLVKNTDIEMPTVSIDMIGLNGRNMLFRNFEGREGKYNAKGNRNFCVRIDNEEVANELARNGYLIKEGMYKDETYKYLKVNLNLWPTPERYTPNIFLTSRGVDTCIWSVDERESELRVDKLDNTSIEKFSVELDPFCYDEGKVSAKVKNLRIYTYDADPNEYLTRHASDDEEPVTTTVAFDTDDDDLPF